MIKTKDRIKQIRKDYGLNQSEFSERLGLSRTFIAQVETDREKFSDRSIRDICREFHVSEAWLRSGEGDMYIPETKNQQIASFMNSVMEEVDESIRKKLILALSRLDDSDWAVLEKIATDMVKEKEG